jgi:hypothetical protein
MTPTQAKRIITLAEIVIFILVIVGLVMLKGCISPHPQVADVYAPYACVYGTANQCTRLGVRT